LALAFGFIANAQCMTACMTLAMDQAAHSCCQHGKTPDTKHCANSFHPFNDPLLKAKAGANIPQFAILPAAHGIFCPLRQTARAGVPIGQGAHSPGSALSLDVLRI
jgi:hypothetical protein